MIGNLQYKLREYGERWVFLGSKIKQILMDGCWGGITGTGETGESSMEEEGRGE